MKTYEIVVSTFSMSDKDDKEKFFEKSFLLADIKPNIVLGMLLLTKSNVDIDFQARDLQWKFYTTGNVLLTTKQVKRIEKKKFAATILDPKYKAFIVHIAALNLDLGG